MNGIIKRMDIMIVEKFISILSHAKLPHLFGGKIVRIAVDLLNLSTSIPLNREISYGIWYGKKASYNQMIVFWCSAFVHIPKDER